MHSAVDKTAKKDEMAENLGNRRPGEAKQRASSACDRARVIADAKKTIRAAELSDDLNIDLQEALVQSLKRGLLELEQLDPDAPIDSAALSAFAQHILSMSKGSP